MRQYDGASQERIASVVEGLTQGRVSRVMSGRDRLASLDLIERLADGLRIPGELLGLASRRWERAQAAGLIVENEHAELHYDGREYRVTIRRRLHNVGSEPVTRFLIRIAVDRYPEDQQKSNEFYRANPLTFDELQLSAYCGLERMTWKVDHDRDAAKEVWLLFGNSTTKFPIYPGKTSEIVYSFVVSDAKWGSWFERAIKVPTHRLAVVLKLPRANDPTVWGTETSMTADTVAIRNGIELEEEDQLRIFRWFTDRPELNARYRFQWRERTPRARRLKVASDATEPPLPSVRMAEAGIVQRGKPILYKPAQPFTLPMEHEDAERCLAQLLVATERVRRLHDFSKGMGIAAPQIGIDRAAAIVITREGEVITLLNPRVVEESAESDKQYEGCLSFFDVRGEVPRPLRIHVEHTSLQEEKRFTIFENSIARLVSHEIDHLEGRLYTDRMAAGVEPIPVAEYRGIGHAWEYPHD
ncbi:MAG: peptide deformylase [Mycobacteriales bacterium]